MKRQNMASAAAFKTRGFSLIELMITVAIIGILSAIAYPAYTQYIVKSNRGAAQAYLIELAQGQAQYMADSREYADTVGKLTPTPAAVSSKYTIDIALTAGPPATFTITARPILTGTQRADGNLTISSSGARGGAGW